MTGRNFSWISQMKMAGLAFFFSVKIVSLRKVGTLGEGNLFKKCQGARRTTHAFAFVPSL